MVSFEEAVAGAGADAVLCCDGIAVVQANIGLRCNMQCAHCHVDASPTRTEAMSWDTMQAVADVARTTSCRLVDITGGAPELHTRFRDFVALLSASGVLVQVRTNLTVLLEDGQEDTPAFLREHGVALVASMPCYLEENVQKQRGADAYAKSIEALSRLNAIGYGVDDALPLNLVYNPLEPVLPPSQSALEAEYRRELMARHGVRFSKLITITNAPLGRFTAGLNRAAYMALLRKAFNADTLERLMCRTQIAVGWDGAIYDCDFNLALGLPVNHGAPAHITAFDAAELGHRRIVTGDHCFACTAGAGSSCGGALT